MERTSFSLLSEETDFIPLITNEEDNSIPDSDLLEEISIMPLRNTVQFPGVVSPITAGRDKSIKLVQGAQKGKKLFGVLAQRDPDTETPNGEHLHSVGTLVQMVKSFKMPDGNITAILQGKRRFRILEVISEEPFLKAKVEYLNDIKASETTEFRALMQHIREMAMDIIQESPNIPTEAQIAVKNIESDTFLIHFIASNMNLDVEKKQAILEEDDVSKRTNAVLKHLSYEKHLLEVKNDIANRVRTEFDQQQREYFLQQQMKTIQEELGGVSNEAELQLMKDKAAKMDWPIEAEKQFEKEILRLQRMNPQVPDFGIQRNYLEFILDLPWGKITSQPIKLAKARKVLDRDHFGLEKVKERLLEHLAVLQLKDNLRSPILCLYGPPGVGKTSLGKSIAEALGRDYVRMSLGGLRDESEIRGHRKTYIGAMAGRILQLIKKAGSSNPVFVLDEIDKLGFGSQGDPSSALLEVLDPEQNKSFYDNFLEMGYDLSKVLFIATANNISSVQHALRDRMELIEVNGYTLEEKEQIGKKYLLPNQLQEHGLERNSIKIRKSEMISLIDKYTRESGVRNLNRELAKLVRKAALAKAEEKEFPEVISEEKLLEIMGTPRFDRDVYQGNEIAGVVTGLAWTPVGGDILFIETSISPGVGKLNITGNLGDVMKESATIAMAYLKGNSKQYDLHDDLFRKFDVHIHVPEGAIPKDGPSAGIALLTALTSLFTQRKVKNKLALSGEITLRGKVLPVGGIREKLLAAKRSGLKQILLSIENKKDVLDIPFQYLVGMNFEYVSNMKEVIDKSVLSQKVKNAKDLKF
ncbi:MAG: Lon protease 2 [Owenweeksia sp. TMED14]|nr:MAG: Lon protease 2 [Owenweeksia sp. TMED14]|tara:strand:+ start:2818 stop:5247 length:2430 start_codon:yes stop_codon:yes gene_type:complete